MLFRSQKLVYTAADDKFVLTGGPPSIFDAEQGKITGVSLTFFRHDDRVLVEGARWWSARWSRMPERVAMRKASSRS